ncbi:DUF6777 domain-containing protein [Streptomyces olivochromogenes]|uniref:DUF6777 domain-containing protein n=1 Tax=Streptomyces olivochromogenes TaxID=1963 RepID=UPI001F38E348|nr:DUF6777 domain-containing protein [Streptomyces olivochromogenes]MCF3133622.1 hypothetical protein [Streptomyces olivochromogenes]
MSENAVRRPTGTIVAAGALSAALLVAGCAAGGDQDSETSEELLLQPVGAQGPDPFTGSTATTADNRTPRSEDATGDTSVPVTGMRTLSGGTPGLYSGIARVGSCDVQRQIGYLTADRSKRRAFAEAEGISEETIPAYLRGLTPVVLRADTRVTSHGYRDGRAASFQSVLQAGTAVLVDDRGMPRVRCTCGNPLKAPEATGGGARTGGSSWAGYRPADVVEVTPAPQVMTSLTLIDLGSRTWIERRTGHDVARDQVVPPPDTQSTEEPDPYETGSDATPDVGPSAAPAGCTAPRTTKPEIGGVAAPALPAGTTDCAPSAAPTARPGNHPTPTAAAIAPGTNTGTGTGAGSGTGAGKTGGADSGGVVPPGSGLTGQGSGLTGQGNGLTGQGSGLTGQGSGLTGQGNGLTGQGSGLTGQGNGLTGQGNSLTGQGSSGLTYQGSGALDPGFGALDPGNGFPGQGSVLPDQFGGVFGQFSGVPYRIGGVPDQFGGLSGRNGEVLDQFGGVPGRTSGALDQFRGVPDPNSEVPGQLDGVPGRNGEVLDQFGGVPGRIAGAPEPYTGLPDAVVGTGPAEGTFPALPVDPGIVPDAPTVPNAPDATGDGGGLVPEGDAARRLGGPSGDIGG